MKAKHIILSTFLYGALSLSMLAIETPESNLTNTSISEFSSGSSEHFLTQTVPGERRRVRRRTRRRVNRRRDRRENATNFSMMNFTKTYIV